MKKQIYRITIKSWETYNSKSRPGHPCIMLSKKFLEDAKIQTLPLGGKLLFLGLLLRRGDVSTTFIEATHKDLVTLSGGSGQVVSRLLRQLQENQLVSYEVLNEVKLSEVKLSEIKLNEVKLNSTSEVDEQKPKPPPKPKLKPEDRQQKNFDKIQNQKIWDAYFDAYRFRYGVEPVRNVTTNSQVSSLRKRLGTEDAVRVVEFFLSHNDGFYLKSTHSIGLCLRDCESLRTQMLRGKAITQATVRNFEKSQSAQETLEQLREGKI